MVLPAGIDKLTSFTLLLKSLNNSVYKQVSELSYLYEKPLFLNSSRFEKEFGEIKIGWA